MRIAGQPDQLCFVYPIDHPGGNVLRIGIRGNGKPVLGSCGHRYGHPQDEKSDNSRHTSILHFSNPLERVAKSRFIDFDARAWVIIRSIDSSLSRRKENGSILGKVAVPCDQHIQREMRHSVFNSTRKYVKLPHG
jgi:hypothetical protein